MTIKRVFKNTMPGTQYLFKNGKAAQFVAGRYETADEVEIAELEAEIHGGIPHIYVDAADTTVDTGEQDYVRDAQVAATAKALKDYQAMKADKAGGTGTYAKNPDGTLVKPGASEAQLVQVNRNDVPVPAVGAAVEVPVSTNATTVIPAKAATPNLAALLHKVPATTGIASSDNVPQAAQSA